MSSPSPLDLCWSIEASLKGHAIAPVLRAAVESHWQEARHLCAVVLGDEALTAEIMELAIQRTATHLAEQSIVNQEDAAAILARCYKNEIRKRQRKHKRLLCDSLIVDSAPDFAADPFSPVEATLDLEKILAETPPDVCTALLMRYGSCARWSEVAERMATSKDTIRKSCKRHLDYIRRRLGVADRSK